MLLDAFDKSRFVDIDATSISEICDKRLDDFALRDFSEIIPRGRGAHADTWG